MKKFLIICILYNFSYGLAQEPIWENPNFRQKTFLAQDTIQVDSLFLLDEGIELLDAKGQLISKEAYSINFERSQVIFHQDISDSIQISYYVHPELIQREAYPQDPKLILPTIDSNNTWVLDDVQEDEKELFDGLQTQGSMVRGISFGNNQGSAVQSSLDLRINGKLSNKIGIAAMISDTNVPIEADGYTQSLEQFDRVYVELFSDDTRARAGHIDLQQQEEYFGVFNRRVSGLQLKHQMVRDSSVTHIDLAGSISRGEYGEMSFNGTEGNQGPYRLVGNHNEAYVIILSGSERIYRNGILLQRGENYDYIMNYNTGELTFTPKHMIRATDRIIAEYQYTNRYYNRFLLYGGAQHVGKRFKISSHMYSERDNKNNSINQNLSADDKALLANVGNNTDEMFVSSAEQVPYDSDKVLYEKVVVNGIEVFVYSNDANAILYEVGFTYMGINQGNYVLSNSSQNGRIFEYVPSMNGVKQGQYEPIRLLVAPKEQQVWSMSSSYDFKKNGSVSLDLGVSNLDENLFSDIDDNSNVGIGVRLSADKTFWWNKIKLIPELKYAFIQKKFSSLEGLRNPEFAREFNMADEFGVADQHFLETDVTAFYSDSIQLQYGFDYLNEKGFYDGHRHRAKLLYLTPRAELQASLKLLDSQTNVEETTFAQYNAYAAKRFGEYEIGVGLLGENNQRKVALGLDSLSNKWNELYTTFQVGDTIQRFAALRLYRRTDDSTQISSLQRYSTALGAEFTTQLVKRENHTLRLLTHYRDMDYADSTQHVSFLNATVEWQKSFLKQAIAFNLKYELIGGTELQRAFVYAEVEEGLGIYKWTDYNGDGVQQIDEFEVAEFQDQASYIRVYTNTVNTLRTNQNNFSVQLQLNPSRYLGTDTFWRRIQSNLMYTSQSNHLKQAKIAVFNPWESSDNLRNNTTHFYWQTKYNAGQQYKWNLTHELSLQDHTRYIFTGLENLETKVNTLNMQYKWKQGLIAELKNRYENVESDSESFASRRFNIKGYDLIPKVYYNWTDELQTSLAYTLRDYENISGIESLKAHQLNFDFTWNSVGKTSMMAGLDWVKNDFAGNANSVVGNRMMEGLKNGNNLVWQLLLQRNINSFLVLNVQYSGRKNESLNAIHTGNVQLRLNF